MATSTLVIVVSFAFAAALVVVALVWVLVNTLRRHHRSRRAPTSSGPPNSRTRQGDEKRTPSL